MNLARWVLKNGRCAADRPAISVGERTMLTYGQWAARSEVLAANLRKLCGPEQRVAIAMTNGPAFMETLFAIWHAGLVAVPMNAKLHADELRYILEDSETALVVASPELAGSVASHCRTVTTDSAEWRRMCVGDAMAMVPRRPDDLAWLFYTSGTTAVPRALCSPTAIC